MRLLIPVVLSGGSGTRLWPLSREKYPKQLSNVLVGTDPVRIVAEVRKVLRGEGKLGRRPHLWDGKAAERIVEVLATELGVEERSIESLSAV